MSREKHDIPLRGGGPSRLLARWKRWWQPILALAVYAGLALAANWPAYPGRPDLFRQGDLTQMAWFLDWTPYALLHGRDLFQTTWLNAPAGVNLAQNTSAPLLGLLAAPLTLTKGVVASMNLLLWLSYVLSAGSMLVVLRRWVRSPLAAFAGGLLYGFSPYMTGQGFNHLNLLFVPLPPLIFLACHELFIRRAGHPLRWGMVLGLLVAAQFYISPEIAATTSIAAAAALVLLAVVRRAEALTVFRYSRGGAALAIGVATVLVAYPVWVMVAGRYRFSGPAIGGSLAADLAGPVLPTSIERVGLGLTSHGDQLVAGDVPENGSYLGLPLIALLGLSVVHRWRVRWARFAAVMLLAMFLLSLGSRLVINGHTTGIPLPFVAVSKIPVLDNIRAVRLSLLVSFFAALLLAIGLAGSATWRWHVLKGLLCAAVVVSLIPSWPYPTAPAAIPMYFTSGAAERIPEGAVVLISPYPSVAQVQPQLWQAAAGMRFQIIGGYGFFGAAKRPFPAVLQPAYVEAWLWAQASGGEPYPPVAIPTDARTLVEGFRQFLRNTKATAVVWVDSGTHAQRIFSLFTCALGPPSDVGGNVSAWYGVDRLVAAQPAACPSTSGITG